MGHALRLTMQTEAMKYEQVFVHRDGGNLLPFLGVVVCFDAAEHKWNSI